MVYLFGIFGLFFGSFFHVVGDRLSRGESIVKPGSHCEGCDKPLSWYELIPVFSYVFLRGKCSKCGYKLSISYVLIELLTGFLFGLSYYMSNSLEGLIIYLVISSILVITYVSDFKYLYILDIPLVLGIVTILITKLVLSGVEEFLFSILVGVVLFLVMYLIKFVGDRVFKRESLGFGDVKLAFLFGVVLGFQLSFVALIIGSLLTLPFAIYFIHTKLESEVPFGPFLITAVYITFMFGNQIMEVLNNLFIY